ncbi:MAG: hypothetical protein EOO24_57970 [Comamonadaceae bacterium]|nr:MAG: hypothetical protein EOO24_57970 [Comamonadaceae bacterium]
MQPGLGALLLSADQDDGLVTRAAQAGVPVLLKPVDEATLAQAVRALQPAAAMPPRRSTAHLENS